MSVAEQVAPDDKEFPAEVTEKVHNSLLWGLWAADAAEDALQWPVDELAAEVAQRPDYGRKIQDILKMLLIEQRVAPLRAELINEMVGHVRAALVQAGLDASDVLMEAPIDFDVVPRFGGVAASDVNRIRPMVQRELVFR